MVEMSDEETSHEKGSNEVISFMSIIGIGLVIQANSSYFYSEPVMKIDEATIVGDSQIITGHLINESSDEKIELEEVFYKTEPITPKYHQGEQLILKESGWGGKFLA